MSLDKYKMIEGNEKTAQELWKKYLPGYTSDQALPDNTKAGTDKNISITEDKQTSWMDTLFMKGREFKTYTWVTKEGIPIATAIRAIPIIIPPILPPAPAITGLIYTTSPSFGRLTF